MLSTDRPEFEEQIRQLCAGYDKPVGDRLEAYWRGLAKMGLVEFARCVEWALAEDSPHPDKIPTTAQIWKMRNDLRRRHDKSAAVQMSAHHAAEADCLEYFANRLLLQHVAALTARGGLQGELPGCLKAKRALVEEFEGYIREGDELATPAEFMRSWIIVLKRVSKLDEKTLSHWRETMEHPEMLVPFAPQMARAIASREAVHG